MRRDQRRRADDVVQPLAEFAQGELAVSVPEAHPHRMPEIRSIPRTVVALGLVSLFMDISSEIIHSLLPVFLVTAVGASALSVGFIGRNCGGRDPDYQTLLGCNQ